MPSRDKCFKWSCTRKPDWANRHAVYGKDAEIDYCCDDHLDDCKSWDKVSGYVYSTYERIVPVADIKVTKEVTVCGNGLLLFRDKASAHGDVFFGREDKPPMSLSHNQLETLQDMIKLYLEATKDA